MKTQKSIFLVLLLALIGTSNLVYAANQNSFYGVWISKNGGLFYEINKDAIVINRIDYSNRYSISKNKYRIVKWEKDKANADKYVIYTLDESDNKKSFEVSIDAYSDLFVFAPPMTLGMEMKKSSAAELNKTLKTAEDFEKAAEEAQKRTEEAKKVVDVVALDLDENNAPRSKAEIMAVVNARITGLRNVYKKYLKLKPGFGGKVTLKFTIAPGGDIVSINIVSSTTDYDEFDNAVKNMVATWKWKIIGSGNTTPTISFNFAE